MRLRKIDPTPDQLSVREYQAMIYIEEDYTAHHDVPTVRDLMAALDMSLGGAKGLLDRLVDYGYLRRGCKNCRRNFRIVKSVHTGQPVPAEDRHWATLYLETFEAQRAEPMPDDDPYVPGPIFHLYTPSTDEQKVYGFSGSYPKTIYQHRDLCFTRIATPVKAHGGFQVELIA
ncbi:MAG: MarR family winged helix-turn-helix transcriptional regulator [Anaerolineae bacterium]|nr:MarR family winged helix-turn-helix transcriptional regulator [Anaerolineae bacterium]